jgi:hypothetical protein
MALQTVFETQDAFHAAIPEGLREHYSEKNGKWTLTVDKPENIATGLAKNRDEFRTEKEKLARQLQDLQSVLGDKKPDEIKALLEAQTKKETEDLQKKGNFDEVLKKKDDAHAKTVTELKAEIEARDAKILSFTLTSRVEKAALEGGINPKQIHRVLADTQKRFRLDGEKIEVLDGDGYPVSTTPEAFFKEIYKADENNAIFYLPTGAGGSGAVNGAGNGNSSKVIKRSVFDQMNPAEKAEKMKAGFTLTD